MVIYWLDSFPYNLQIKVTVNPIIQIFIDIKFSTSICWHHKLIHSYISYLISFNTYVCVKNQCLESQLTQVTPCTRSEIYMNVQWTPWYKEQLVIPFFHICGVEISWFMHKYLCIWFLHEYMLFWWIFSCTIFITDFVLIQNTN